MVPLTRVGSCHSSAVKVNGTDGSVSFDSLASVIGKLGAELLGRIGRRSRIAHRHACRRELEVYAAIVGSVKPSYPLREPFATARLPRMQQLFVLFHSPGPKWDHAIGFMEQTGVGEHVTFMRSLTARALMVLGGPFDDGDAKAAVGMAVITAQDIAAAKRVALEDGSVASGLIRVSVRPWNVPMGFALEAIPPVREG